MGRNPSNRKKATPVSNDNLNEDQSNPQNPPMLVAETEVFEEEEAMTDLVCSVWKNC